MRFKDLHPHSSSIHYSVTNEEPMIWRDFVRGKYIGRAAGICSAGEVGFFSILPSVRSELVLIDHSYRSLATAMLKYLLLRERGWQDTIRLLTAAEAVEELKVTIAELKVQLPEKITETVETMTREYTSCILDGYSGRLHPGIKRVWEELPRNLIKQASRKLDLVTFAHGDLEDLADLGPFDMLYISNAFGHRGRNGHPGADKVAHAVKKNGLVIGCNGYGLPWENVRTEPGRKSSWQYSLYRPQAPVPAAAGAN